MIIDLTSVSGTQSLWKKDRIVLYGIGQDYSVSTLFWTDLHGSQSSPIATYTPTSTEEVYIDVTDYVRAYPSVTHLYVYSAQMQSVVDVEVQVVGLINPEDVILPYQKLQAGSALVVPPSMILHDGSQSNNIEAEFYATAGNWGVTGNASISQDKRYVGQITGSFTLSDGTRTKAYTPTLMRCDVLYAQVRWESFTGQERVHFWEVVKQTQATENAYSLMSADNSYIEIKGRADGFTLRLEGLDVYDLWYYSDILTSSKVEIYDGSKWQRVQVATKEVTLPDGEAGMDGKLEVKVNYKRYDAVTM